MATLTWSELNPSGNLPSARDSHIAIYDAWNNRMIIFGGEDNNGSISDLLWSLNLSNLTWTQLSPSGESLPPRSLSSAVYDNVYGKMILFGGKYSETNYFNDCYLLNLSPRDESWSKLSFEFSPSGRYGHKAAFDTENQQMILFGGYDGREYLYLNDAWILSSERSQPPIASFTYSPENPVVGEEVTFDASLSSDADGEIVFYEWDFGDGNTDSGEAEVVTHTYSTAGDYTVILTVTDDDEGRDSASKSVSTSPAPTVPDIELSASSFHFADVIVGQSKDTTLVVSNVGNTDLSVSNISSSDGQFGASPTSFTVVTNGASWTLG